MLLLTGCRTSSFSKEKWSANDDILGLIGF